MNRKVTEEDFRMPEYRGAKVEDYEFRADGKLVRKDRWEQGIQSIRYLVGIDGREFEIHDVVEKVRELVGHLDDGSWVDNELDCDDEKPGKNDLVEIEMTDGSRLKGVQFQGDGWYWLAAALTFKTEKVRRWRHQQDS